jgi:Cof subfamily protein (haloacid dehalogenase superfamily)
VKPDIRLIAIDIDGTLLDPHFQVSAANLDALRKAHDRGIEVILVTGRRHTFALPIAEALGFDLWLITSNGAVTRSTKGEAFHRDLLPKSTALKLLEHMADYRSNCVLTFDHEGKGALALETMEELNLSIQRWLEKNSQYLEFVRPLEGCLTEDPIQAMFCGTVKKMETAVEHLAKGPFVDEITVLRTQYVARDLTIVDVLNQGCSKGHAVERWATYRGLTREQVMAIGDNYNDIEMLAFAGFPVIMGNASDDLKQNGWLVTKGNDQSGVAAAVEQVL